MRRMKSALRVFIVSLVFAIVFLPCSASADPLDNWHQRTSGTTSGLYGVAYGNGTFVAVGWETILSSSDGVTWTDRYTGSGLVGLMFNAIAYGNGTFVAVGPEGCIATSPDGVTWTDRSIGWGGFSAVAYGGNSFVAVGYNGEIIKSVNNGEIWTALSSGTANPLRGVAYCDGVGCEYPTWTAVGDYGTIITSTNDGATWGPATSAIGYDLDGIAFTGASMGAYYMPRFVAVGEGGMYASDDDGWIHVGCVHKYPVISQVNYGLQCHLFP